MDNLKFYDEKNTSRDLIKLLKEHFDRLFENEEFKQDLLSKISHYGDTREEETREILANIA